MPTSSIAPSITPTVTPSVAPADVVRRYFDACNTGDRNALLATMTDDVVHHFLAPQVPTIRSARALADFWVKWHRALDPRWAIDRLVADGDTVVAEWSVLWTPRGSARRVMMRGTDWYELRDGRIAEVRAYHGHDPDGDSQLPDFDYAGRRYFMPAR